MYHRRGVQAIFIVNQQDENYHSPIGQDILPGITRQAIIQLAKEQNSPSLSVYLH